MMMEQTAKSQVSFFCPFGIGMGILHAHACLMCQFHQQDSTYTSRTKIIIKKEDAEFANIYKIVQQKRRTNFVFGPQFDVK
jgi:hypothetical protein